MKLEINQSCALASFDEIRLNEVSTLSCSDGADEYSVNKFLCRVFDGCSTSTGTGNLGSIIIDSASRELDMKEEVRVTHYHH